jgi:hypothetical protein
MKLNVDYLYKSMGGTPQMLQQCPEYLLCDLFRHVIPRAEFLRLRGKEPLFQGLHFLVGSKPKDLASAAGVEVERNPYAKNSNNFKGSSGSFGNGAGGGASGPKVAFKKKNGYKKYKI